MADFLLPGEKEEDKDKEFLLPGETVGAGAGFQLPGEDASTAGQNLTVTSMDEAEKLAILPSLSEVWEEIGRGLLITHRDLQSRGAEAASRESAASAENDKRLLMMLEDQLPELLPGTGDRVEDDIRRREVDRVNQYKDAVKFATDQLVQRGIPPESIGGGIVRDVTRMSAYAGATITLFRGAGLGPITSSLAGTAIADLAAFDGDEPRIANWLAEINNDQYTDAVAEFLKADPNDPKAVQKFKQATEGVILAGVGEAAGRLIAKSFFGVVGYARTKFGRSIGHVSGGTPIPRFSEGIGSPEIVAVENQIEGAATELLQGRFKGEALPKITKVKTGTQSVEELTLEEVTKTFQARVHELDPGGLLTPRQIADKVIAFRDVFSAQLKIPPLDRAKGKQLYQRLLADSEAIEKASTKTIREKAAAVKNDFVKHIVDRSGNLKAAILQTGGPEAQRAVQFLELAQGASTTGHHYYREAWKKVFGVQRSLGIYTGLDQQTSTQLNQLIKARRIKEIKSYKAAWREPIELPGGRKETTTFTDWENTLKVMRMELGEERWGELTARADAYFSEMKKTLDVMHKSGLIDDEELMRLGRHEYSPIEFIDKIDPPMATYKEGKRTISVGSSGIEKLGRGEEGLILENADLFLAQVISRAHARAARNRANQALFALAEKIPDNGVVVLKKPKEGQWAQISVMENGEPKKMFLRKEFVDQWNASPIGLNPAITILSGAPFIRPLATGINPEFMLSNFPRDLMYSWLTAGDGALYSTNIVRAIGELTGDLRATAKDAWGRKGAFLDYIDQGGGMNLMTHQGRLGAKEISNKPISGVARTTSELQHILGYLNETSEIWVRLAVRNRAVRQGMKEGMSAVDAAEYGTWQARRYLDFSQGGGWTKKVDHAMPYTNAGVQGIRGAVRAAKNNPAIFTAKVGQMMGVYGGVWMANNYVNPDAWEQIPNYIRNRYMVITTPFYRTDLEGNRRYMYLKLPIDHSTMPFKAATDAMFDRAFKGEVPKDTTTDLLSTMTSVVPGVNSMPPTVDAMMKIWFNVDWWRNDEVWKGPKDIPLYKEVERTGERPTSRLAEDIGGFIGPSLEGVTPLEGFSSPARMEAAFKSFIPDNIYTQLAGQGFKSVIDALSDDERNELYKTLQQQLREAPFSRRLIGETHPLVQDVDDIQMELRATQGDRYDLNQELDLMLQNMQQESPRLTGRQSDMVERWISQQDPLDQQMLARRFENSVKLNEIFRGINIGTVPGMAQRDAWVWVSGAPPEVRANFFAQQYSMALDDTRSEYPEDRAAGQKKLRMLRQLATSMSAFSPHPKQSPEYAEALRRAYQDLGVPPLE